MPQSTFEIDVISGVWERLVSTSPEGIVGEWADEAARGEAVRAAGPISGDTVRTSVSEGKVSEEGSLDIT